jgi:hypothetical protein
MLVVIWHFLASRNQQLQKPRQDFEGRILQDPGNQMTMESLLDHSETSSCAFVSAKDQNQEKTFLLFPRILSNTPTSKKDREYLIVIFIV